jgi:predicted negative regulator of RcsB-dependent stress response
MATYDLEEQEQIAEIKAWWKQYGNLVTGIVTAASIGVIAWQGWNWYQRGQAAQASVVYGVLQKAVVDNDSQRIKAASGELLEKFAGTATRRWRRCRRPR